MFERCEAVRPAAGGQGVALLFAAARQLIQHLFDALDFALGVIEEVDGEHAHDVPVVALERLHLQNVPVFAGRAGSRGAVAQHGEDEALRVARVEHGAVDLEFGYAQAGAAVVAVALQLAGDIFADAIAPRLQLARVDGERGLALFSKFEERLQPRHAAAVGLGQIDHGRGHRGKDEHLFAGAGDGDVQAAPAARLVEGAKVEGDAPTAVRPVADGEEDDVSLVPLHVFEVFDEQRLFALVGGLFQPALGKRFGQAPLDVVLLGGAEGHHADAGAGELRVGEPSHHFRNQRLRFRLVALGKAPVIHAVAEDEAHMAL